MYLLAPEPEETLLDLVVILETLLISLGQVLTKISLASREFSSSITLPKIAFNAFLDSSVMVSGSNVILLNGSTLEMGS